MPINWLIMHLLSALFIISCQFTVFRKRPKMSSIYAIMARNIHAVVLCLAYEAARSLPRLPRTSSISGEKVAKTNQVRSKKGGKEQHQYHHDMPQRTLTSI